MRRLLLVRHAPTAATRAAAFPADESLDASGHQAAAGLALTVPAGFEVLCSPARRARETAAALGLDSPVIEPDLAECDFGAWAGRTLAEVAAADAEAATAWMTDPAAVPHGGESLAALAARVGAWLRRQAILDGGAVAITHGGVVRAAVVTALGAPLAAAWRLDALPLRITELRADQGRWTLARANCTISEAPV